MSVDIKPIYEETEMDIGDITIDVVTAPKVDMNVNVNHSITSYPELNDLPKINGVEIKGEQTTEDWGIIIPTKVSELENDANFLQHEEDPSVPQWVKGITEENIAEWNSLDEKIAAAKVDINLVIETKQDKEEGKGLSSNDFTDEDKIKLASLENYNDEEIRAEIATKQPAGDYALKNELITKTSELINDSDFVEDSNYIHTDNNFTNHEKAKLASLNNYDDTFITEKIDKINEKIPTQASSENQLADKDFVNSSIATNTAYFIGTFNSIEELQNYTGDLTNNDYAFIISKDSIGNTEYKRYKYNEETWLYEYTLNNSSFTSEQWSAIQSEITNDLVIKLQGIESGAQVNPEAATKGDIGIKVNNSNPIVPSNLDYAVKVGISTNVFELSEEEKEAAKNWIGVVEYDDTEIKAQINDLSSLIGQLNEELENKLGGGN